MALTGNRLGHAIAERFWSGVRRGRTRIEHVTRADLEVARSIGQAFPDQECSIVDRSSFAVMERLGVTRVATFDHRLAVYRFGPGRRHALEVVR